MEENGWISSDPMTAPGKAEQCETDSRVYEEKKLWRTMEQSCYKSPQLLLLLLERHRIKHGIRQ